MAQPLDVTALRAQLPGLEGLVYMNTGWQGPTPQPVLQAVAEALAGEAAAPTAPPVMESRLALVARAREAVAALIGASPEEVSLQENTTAGINLVLWGLDLRPGDEVVTTSVEHPSVAVPVLYAQRRRGIVVRTVILDASLSPQEVLERFAAQMGPRTRLLALSHVSYRTGQLLPIAELARMAHAAGALILVDAAQSVGQIPVDVRSLDCDFFSFPGHKWLLGPAGTGALYVRRDLVPPLEPPLVSHRAVLDYDIVAGRLDPCRDDIAKFELTTRSVPLLAGLVKAIELYLGLGPEAVAERCRRLADLASRLLAGIPRLQLLSPAPGAVRSGLVSFRVEGMDAWGLTAALWERGRVVARTLPVVDGVRLSLHAFNTEEEVERTAALVEELVRTGLPSSASSPERDAMSEL